MKPISYLATWVEAAPKKLATKSQPAKPKLIREVLGTTQLSGYEGKPGQTFTLGKNPAFNFTLRRVEYSIGRVNVGTYAHYPKGDEKMLLLRFTVQNPLPRVLNFSSSYLAISAVDANGVTRNYIGDIARETTAEPVRIALNPGQKIDAYTAIPVAAFGAVPKLIVRNAYETTAPIVRYDVRGVAQKLAVPYADASDKSGATALKTVPAKTGVWYPVVDYFDARLDKIEYSNTLQGREAGSGKRYCLATFTLKNMGKRPARYGYSYFRADLKDADGEKTEYNTSMLKGSRDEESYSTLAPGEEVRVRFHWAVPANVAAKTVLLQYGYDRESRTFAFAVPQ